MVKTGSAMVAAGAVFEMAEVHGTATSLWFCPDDRGKHIPCLPNLVAD